MAMYNAGTVADFIIDKCTKDENPISNLKLQKILYFVWVDYFKQTQRTLFVDSICAWQFGPVVPDVYYEYCGYGGRPINLLCEVEISKEDQRILTDIINKYEYMPVSDLVAITHCPGMAWDQIYQDGKGNHKPIPFSLIRQTEEGKEYVS